MLSKNLLKISLLSLVAFVNMAKAETIEELKTRLFEEYGKADVVTVTCAIEDINANIKTKKESIARAKNAVKHIYSKNESGYNKVSDKCENGQCDVTDYESSITELCNQLKIQGSKNVKISKEIDAMMTEKTILEEIVKAKQAEEIVKAKQATGAQTN